METQVQKERGSNNQGHLADLGSTSSSLVKSDHILKRNPLSSDFPGPGDNVNVNNTPFWLCL